MEEASAAGDLALVKKSFARVLLSSDGRIPLKDRIFPGANEVMRRSACLAAEHGHASIFSFLLDQGMPITRIVVDAAFKADDVEFCRALTEHGWKPLRGEVPLSSVLSSEIALKWVLEHGWNPNIYGHNDLHPMTVAASQFPLSTVKILLDHGVSTRGTTAMHTAAFQAANDPTRYDVLDLLLLYAGDVNEMEVDPKGLSPPRRRTPFTGTPLHHAIRAGSVEPVRYLLEKELIQWLLVGRA